MAKVFRCAFRPLVVAVTAFWLIGYAVAAWADPWGNQTSDTGAHPDSDPHTYCYYESQLDDDARNNIYSAEWDAMDPTAVNVDYQSSCDFSGDTETDVVWFTGPLGGTKRGEAFCEDFDTYCDQYYVTLDMTVIAVGSNDEQDETKTACHELGHTAGLSHSSNDCLITGERPSSAMQWERYSPHHRDDHLTPWFN